MGASLPGNRIGMRAAPITDVATSVDSSVCVQDLFVPAVPGRSDAISVSGNRGSVDGEEQRGTGPPLTNEGENAVIGIVQIDPLESCVAIILLRKRRLVLVKEIKMLDQPFNTSVQGILQQMPVDTLIVIPFFPLTNFASHEQQLFSGVRVHPGVKHSEVGEFLPWITRHFI